MDKQKLDQARHLAEQEQARGESPIASALLLVIAALQLDSDAQPPSTSSAQSAADPRADTQPAGVIEASPPPLTSSIPPGTYEQPRTADGSNAYAAASSIYEPPRNADGSIAPPPSASTDSPKSQE